VFRSHVLASDLSLSLSLSLTQQQQQTPPSSLPTATDRCNQFELHDCIGCVGEGVCGWRFDRGCVALSTIVVDPDGFVIDVDQCYPDRGLCSAGDDGTCASCRRKGCCCWFVCSLFSLSLIACNSWMCVVCHAERHAFLLIAVVM
jgi:hypothetical protein